MSPWRWWRRRQDRKAAREAEATAERREREVVEDRIAWQRLHTWIAGIEEPRGGR